MGCTLSVDKQVIQASLSQNKPQAALGPKSSRDGRNTSERYTDGRDKDRPENAVPRPRPRPKQRENLSGFTSSTPPLNRDNLSGENDSGEYPIYARHAGRSTVDTVVTGPIDSGIIDSGNGINRGSRQETSANNNSGVKEAIDKEDHVLRSHSSGGGDVLSATNLRMIRSISKHRVRDIDTVAGGGILSHQLNEREFSRSGAASNEVNSARGSRAEATNLSLSQKNRVLVVDTSTPPNDSPHHSVQHTNPITPLSRNRSFDGSEADGVLMAFDPTSQRRRRLSDMRTKSHGATPSPLAKPRNTLTVNPAHVLPASPTSGRRNLSVGTKLELETFALAANGSSAAAAGTASEKARLSRRASPHGSGSPGKSSPTGSLPGPLSFVGAAAAAANIMLPSPAVIPHLHTPVTGTIQHK